MFITIKPSVLKIESNGDQWKSIVFHSGEIKIGFVYIWQMNNSRMGRKRKKTKDRPIRTFLTEQNDSF